VNWRCVPHELGAQIIVEWNDSPTRWSMAINTAASIDQVDATLDELQQWLEFPLRTETRQTMRNSLRAALAP
jgi:hypothetical protein